MSIILAPPIIVLIKDAWPGQSTKVNYIYFYLFYLTICWNDWLFCGTFVKNAENPKSNVIFLS